jgi:hypothetical protein
VTATEETVTCANCGRLTPGSSVDPAGWCADCRREVVRRATVIAHALGGVAAVLGGVWVVMVVEPGARFVLVWAVLVGLIYFVLYKLARRVAFEAIRSRGVRPPQSE